jgi:mannose-6-phosphate isomerase-like protein (cupin superfamily)
MNEKEVLSRFARMFPGMQTFKVPEKNPTEVLCEILRVEMDMDDENFSLAYAVIEKSLPHKHNHTHEAYYCHRGYAIVHIDDGIRLLQEDDVLDIEPGKVHWVETVPGAPVTIFVKATPAWTPEDHILVDL